MPRDRASARRQALLAGSLILAAMIAVLVAWGPMLHSFVQDRDRVRAWVGQFGPWGPVAISALELAQALVAPIPGQAIEAVSGYLYGPWLGALYAMVGIATGSLLNFLLARRFGRSLLTRLTNPGTVARLDDLAQQGGAIFFFLLWLFPFVPDDLACLAAGLTPMSVRRFFLLMALGRFPGIFVSTWIGSSAVGISPGWWVALLAGLALAAVATWHWGNALQATMIRFLQGVTKRLRP
jgi:uncharacterized membrane protein YdjX (TVP38/TMEM64 family)